MLGNGLQGSWLIRVPGSNRASADLVLHTGDGPPLCLPLIPTERQTLVFDASNSRLRVPDGEYASFQDLGKNCFNAVVFWRVNYTLHPASNHIHWTPIPCTV